MTCGSNHCVHFWIWGEKLLFFFQINKKPRWSPDFQRQGQYIRLYFSVMRLESFLVSHHSFLGWRVRLSLPQHRLVNKLHFPIHPTVLDPTPPSPQTSLPLLTINLQLTAWHFKVTLLQMHLHCLISNWCTLIPIHFKILNSYHLKLTQYKVDKNPTTLCLLSPVRITSNSENSFSLTYLTMSGEASSSIW